MDNEIRTAAEAYEADALPRRYEVQIDRESIQAQDEKVPGAAGDVPPARKSPAQWAYERIVLYLKKFEEQLDGDHEVAMGFTGADAGVLRIVGMGYFDPDIITFYGADPAGGKMQQIQHVSQLNVILRALPKAVKGEAPNRIGFRLVQDLEKEAEQQPATT
ncbi:hypothetical protein BOO69_03710 [Sulfitobacter alexandrii]|uniref:Uncharacterized protein n=1 Tax=Sulfitobacter alexandrii TaxID=1917485 RepID=A0A1J0WEL5_9RHOB|nr:DUF6173 family protein [Sulfitobacter alexandrii]APE42624.1 hypothetical protein BOO69_03710 [Sulfitobacter alexandrii]